jgi:MoaA/NifB/PqqE/SkfB family radical SAM enzyme
MPYRSNQLLAVHLEITERCNASCPMCARNQAGGAENPWLSRAELRLADIKAILLPGLISRLQFVLFCGNFGDPAVARDALPMLHYLRKCNPRISLGVNSNGSVRSTGWWAELGILLSAPGDICRLRNRRTGGY